jgi:hypothetical protein
MNKWLRYENIWARNIIFAMFMFVLVYTQTKFSSATSDSPMLTDLELIIQFHFIFLSLFFYNHFVVRNLFFNQKYTLFGAVTAGYIVLVAIGTHFFDKYTGVYSSFGGEIISTFMSLFLGTCIYIGHNWVVENIIKTKTQLLDRESEIKFLKQQISPHFLFNAINNLYGTALAAPEIVKDKILELSDLLRYQVESTTKNLVPIEDEMAFVANYFNYTTYKTNNLIVTNNTEGEVKTFNISPLLFLPLIENAIKYAAETENAFIHVLWVFEENTFRFYIENSYLTEGSTLKGTKIGIENLRKRLELLSPQHSLKIDLSTQNTYKIELKLWKLSINA